VTSPPRLHRRIVCTDVGGSKRGASTDVLQTGQGRGEVGDREFESATAKKLIALPVWVARL